MFRAVVLAVSIASLAACVTSPRPGSLTALEQQCVGERTRLIRDAWSSYEFNYRIDVVYPDWMMLAPRWARVECRLGRPVAEAYPQGPQGSTAFSPGQ